MPCPKISCATPYERSNITLTLTFTLTLTLTLVVLDLIKRTTPLFHPTHWLLSLLHFLAAVHLMSRNAHRAAPYLRVRLVAFQTIFPEAISVGSSCCWEYLGDVLLSALTATGKRSPACDGTEAEEAVRCYEASWRMTAMLYGKEHENAKTVRAKLKMAKAKRGATPR